MYTQLVCNELCHPLSNTSASSESILQNISVLNKANHHSMCMIKKQIINKLSEKSTPRRHVSYFDINNELC